MKLLLTPGKRVLLKKNNLQANLLVKKAHSTFESSQPLDCHESYIRHMLFGSEIFVTLIFFIMINFICILTIKF